MKNEGTRMPDTIRRILTHASEFKRFWKDQGPFKYALTSNEFPPVLLAPEEWIFGNSLRAVLKELMQFRQNKMAFLNAPFNPANKQILRPENLIPWQISHFPEAWNHMACRAFMPEGHLTVAVTEKLAGAGGGEANKETVEAAFFSLLEQDLESMGYLLLKPKGKSKYAAIRAYLDEWEADETDAGLI